MPSLPSYFGPLTNPKSRKLFLRILLIAIFLVFLLGIPLVRRHPPSWSIRGYQALPLAPLISPYEDVYVVSLRHRYDRRADMEILRKVLAIPEWTYVVATGASDEIVGSVMRNVRRLREWVVEEVQKTMNNKGEVDEATDPLAVTMKLPFRWPGHSTLDKVPQRLAQFSSLVQEMPEFDLYQDSTSSISQNPLVCSKGDFTLTPYTPTLRKHMIISPARVACWHSHLEIIRHVARNEEGSNTMTIILEDDVDIEIDVRQRLSKVWNLLPPDWDIIFLGHCWSNETTYAPLLPRDNASCSDLTTECGSWAGNASFPNLLHPSYAPQCTHAYVLSSSGAKKLYGHLSYPPFAYSRAIDQAFAWLVKSGRLSAFSVVPPVAVQRRPPRYGWLSRIPFLGRWFQNESDVWSRRSSWRDGLVNGVLGTTYEEK
ncbi:hypothetical protein V5O48_009226 [Marasmius crinis-equi]|uniref:Glycosyltransferase family 25 protein n=1 Tax=Marasmius crinis-equi TaxID=585013 RepID=A0ABR3FBW5_9AGAR